MINNEIREKIKQDRLNGLTLQEIANQHKVSVASVLLICGRKYKGEPKDLIKNIELKNHIVHLYDTGVSMLEISKKVSLKYYVVRDVIISCREIDQSRRGRRFDLERAKKFDLLRKSGCTYQEIANENGCTRQNVQQYVSRYRKDFAELEQESTDNPQAEKEATK
jgi:DNA-binding CsgD family transcriptional regulator